VLNFEFWLFIICFCFCMFVIENGLPRGSGVGKMSAYAFTHALFTVQRYEM
jgi:hypothetical protein